MFISETIIIDIIDKSTQAIRTNVLTEMFVNVSDGQSRASAFPMSDQTIKISTVGAGGILSQTPVEFTDALYGAEISESASFAPGETFRTIVNIYNYTTASNFVNVDMVVETGVYRDEEISESETHKISGILSDDGTVIVLEKDTHELLRSEAFPAGNYTIDIPQRLEVDVVAKRASDAMVKGYGNVVPDAK